jgi:molecular chaperone GrpE (heat shock protein)
LLVRPATTVQQQNHFYPEAEMTTQVTHTEHLHTAQEVEARRIAAEEWQRKLAQSNREAAEAAERFAKDQQDRHDANAKAKQILLDFIKVIHDVRPTREKHGFGPQLDLVILHGIHDIAEYFHDHLRDHYDARADK